VAARIRLPNNSPLKSTRFGKSFKTCDPVVDRRFHERASEHHLGPVEIAMNDDLIMLLTREHFDAIVCSHLQLNPDAISGVR
jgi:hypothetical protein